MRANAKAIEWVRIDVQNCLSDIDRLGLRGAVKYNMALLRERITAGDTRWAGILERDMRDALKDAKENKT